MINAKAPFDDAYRSAPILRQPNALRQQKQKMLASFRKPMADLIEDLGGGPKFFRPRVASADPNAMRRMSTMITLQIKLHR